MTSATQQSARAAVTERALQAVRARAPQAVEVVALNDDPDLSRIDFLVPTSRDHDAVEALPGLERLSVVQLLSAGTDWIEDRVPATATLCSARGARDGPVAEWVLAALLGASSTQLECARERNWRQRHLTDLASWTVLVLGMGSIGRLVASHLRMLGARVIGVAAHARDGLHGPEDLLQLLPRADAIVVLTPLTESTRGLVGGRELAALRDGSLLINAARGQVVESDALLAELTSGRLRAVLDVTDPEPLPEDHPLWDAPGTLSITPHVAGDSPLGHARAAELAGEQLARWCAGEELRNVVRPATG